MAVRSTMTALILRLRRMIGDAAGEGQTWQDEDLQEFLDANRTEARYVELSPVETVSAGGAIEYLIFTAPQGDWEDDAELVNSSFDSLTPTTEDLLVGRWTFSTAPSYPVYATGFYYDLNGAAVEALEAWQAREKLSFDFRADGHDLKRSQKFEMLGKLADKFRKTARARTGCLISGDFEGVDGFGA